VQLRSIKIEAGKRIDYRVHDGVVGPEAAVDHQVAVVLQRPEEGRRGGGREADLHDLLMAIDLVTSDWVRSAGRQPLRDLKLAHLLSERLFRRVIRHPK
jgi:hypothetical protein